MRIAIYPGTFDPITNGHTEIIKRAARYLCDELILSIAHNDAKGPLFSIEQRLDICQKVVATMDEDIAKKIKVMSFHGLLVHHAKSQGAQLVVRGLRAVSDFEFEFQMAGMNARIIDGIETIFLMAGERHQFISSRFVKEIHKFGGDISSCVHPIVLQALKDCYPHRDPNLST